MRYYIVLGMAICMLNVSHMHSAYGEVGVPLTLFPDASYVGTHSWERVGYCLSGVGDVNGDGYDDFAIGSFHTNINGGNSGGVYLLLGKSSGLTNGVNLNNADARFTGKEANDALGYDIGQGGDVNGDGYNDIIISAPSASNEERPGRAYVVFGESTVDWGMNFILEDSADISIEAVDNDHPLGRSIDIIGDLNDDGYDEFIIGNIYDEGLGLSNQGAAYLFMGKSNGWSRHMSPGDADAIFYGHSVNSGAGSTCKGIGDVNGDGISDFAIGAGNGEIYIIFGRLACDWGQNFILSDADIIIAPEEESGLARALVIAPAGDVNGDDYKDFIIGDHYYPRYYYDYISTGRVYIFFGKGSGWQNMNRSEADVIFDGESEGDGAGRSIAGNFDYNGDGLSDILVGAQGNDQNGVDAGKVYLIYGRSTGWPELKWVNDYFWGQLHDDCAGTAVDYAGDFNADGGADLIISAPLKWIWPTGERTGKVYLFLGESHNLTLEGSVHYYTDLSVSDVEIWVNDLETTQTDASAYYLVNVIPGENLTVTPSKPSGEDVNTTISSFDAALVARFAVGLESFTADQKRAADGDQDENTTMYDAVQIARYAVGLPISAGVHVGDWIFEPENRYYPNIDQSYSAQDYEATIIGDVDGNWDPVLPKMSDFKDLTNVWDESFSIDQDTLTIHFLIHEHFPFLSFDLTLEFDQAVFDFLSIKKSENDKPFQVFSSMDNSVLHVGGFRIEPSEDDLGQFVSIQFKIHDPVQNKGSILLRRLQLNDQMVSGTVVLFENRRMQTEKPMFVVDSNYPNPFNNSTTVQFDIPNEGMVYIVVFNEKGSVVRHLLEEPLQAGHHSIKWNGMNDDGISVASGLYLMTIMYKESMKTLKILLLK